MRTCPLCDEKLVVRQSKGVEVDLCPVCTGLWLDEGEFDALVAKRVGDGVAERFLRETRRPADTCRFCGTTSTQGTCPSCGEEIPRPCPADGAAMEIVDAGGLELDLCPTCGGIWLDGDERRSLGARRRASMASLPASARSRAHPIDDAPTTRKPDEKVVCNACGTRVGVDEALSVGRVRYCARCVQRLGGATAGIDDVPAGQHVSSLVTCASCGGEEEQQRSVKRGGAWICERCVLENKLISHRIATEAAGNPVGSVEPHVMLDEIRAGTARLPAGGDDDVVTCAGCRAVVERVRSLSKGELHFCERCVIEGRHPDSSLPNAQAAYGEAIAKFARAKAKQQERRAILSELGGLRPVRRNILRGGYRIDPVDAVRATMLKLRLLFGRDEAL